MAFVIDAFSRRILGWRAATSMRTELVLDALDMAIWARGRQGVVDLSGLVHHSDAGSQYQCHLVNAGESCELPQEGFRTWAACRMLIRRLSWALSMLSCRDGTAW